MRTPFYVVAIALGVSSTSVGDFEIVAFANRPFVTLNWESADPDAVYTVEFRNAPSHSWSPVHPVEQWPIATTQFTDPTAAQAWLDYGQRFYRVLAEPAPPPEGMVRIPAGTFTMGAGTDDYAHFNEKPMHDIYVSSFCIDRTEVTEAFWTEVHDWAVLHGYDFDNAGSGKGAAHPVHTVNWYDAAKWCNARSEKEGRTPCYFSTSAKTTVYKTGQIGISRDMVAWDASGYRLPTEAEWEKAARGAAVGHRFPWSDNDTIQHARANYASYWVNGQPFYPFDVSPTEAYHPDFDTAPYPYTSPVGSFPPTGHGDGLYDMAGNVWEWCFDWYGEYWYEDPAADEPDTPGPPSASLGPNSHVLRGGGWKSDAYDARCSRRTFEDVPGIPYDDRGFRCVSTE